MNDNAIAKKWNKAKVDEKRISPDEEGHFATMTLSAVSKYLIYKLFSRSNV